MSTKAGKTLHLAKRVRRVETALAALERHPAADGTVRRAVRACRVSLFPVLMSIGFTLAGKKLSGAADKIVIWLKSNDIDVQTGGEGNERSN